MTLIDRIKKHEGFMGNVYKDHLGFDTVGYGTKMPIDEAEATLLLQHRLDNMIVQIHHKKPVMDDLDDKRKDIIYEMCYQMGVAGVLKFKNMWKAIEEGKYKRAAKEMLDSRWAEQTPQRARTLAYAMGEN